MAKSLPDCISEIVAPTKDILTLAKESNALADKIERFVKKVNNGLYGPAARVNWTPEKLAELEVFKEQFASMQRVIDLHPDRGMLR